MKWTDDQRRFLDEISESMKMPRGRVTFKGFRGIGKTTALAAAQYAISHGSVCVVCVPE